MVQKVPEVSAINHILHYVVHLLHLKNQYQYTN